MNLRISSAFLLLAALYGQNAAAPAFEDYPVATRWRGKPATVKFDGKGLPDSDARAREIVELAAEDGPNFAGRFTLARWGCATGCFRMVVIDAPTGRVVAEGCFDNETHDKPDCARRYYRWDGAKFVLMQSAAVE
jgi:hypothetical protein